MEGISPDDELLFCIQTPLGFSVRTTRSHWNLITTAKHPVMANCQAEVEIALAQPDEVRQSRKDLSVHLFYRLQREKTLDLRRGETPKRRRILDHCLSHGCHQRRRTNMAQVKVFYDRLGNTLTVWFGAPQEEYVCEETGEEVVLMKDHTGKVIGFEKLNFSAGNGAPFQVGFEAAEV